MKHKHMMLHDINYFGINVYIAYNNHLNAVRVHDCLQNTKTSSMVKYDLRFEISNLNYPGIDVHIASNSFFGSL